MASPAIHKAREERDQAHADVVANLRGLSNSIRNSTEGSKRIPEKDLDHIEQLLDNAKASIVFYTFTLRKVESMEED